MTGGISQRYHAFSRLWIIKGLSTGGKWALTMKAALVAYPFGFPGGGVLIVVAAGTLIRV